MATDIKEYTVTDAALADLKTKYEEAVYDVTTTAGMAAAIAGRAELRTLRVAIEKKRVEIKASVLERAKLIDSEATRIKKAISVLEDPIGLQITAHQEKKEREKKEAAERELVRIAAVQARLAAIGAAPVTLVGQSAAALREYVAAFVMPPLDEFQEFAEIARITFARTAETVNRMLEDAVNHEAEQAKIIAERAELEQLRKQNQDLKDAADKARADADALAEVERRRADAAAQAERDRLAREAKAAQDLIDAERKAAQDIVDAERKVQQEIQDAARKVAQDIEDREREAAAEVLRKQKQDLDEQTRLNEQKARDEEIEKARVAKKWSDSLAEKLEQENLKTIQNCTLLEAAKMAYDLLCDQGLQNRLATRALAHAIPITPYPATHPVGWVGVA